MDHPFVRLLTHPAKRALAIALVSGASHASLYPEYGKGRVQEMARRIKLWKPGDSASKALPCEHCGKGGVCRIV